jgi:hypothetical protein
MIGSSSQDRRLSGSVVVYGNATRMLERYWRMRARCRLTMFSGVVLNPVSQHPPQNVVVPILVEKAMLQRAKNMKDDER